MANRTISTMQLTPGDVIGIRGKLSFGRLASKIEGQELINDQIKRRQRGWIPIEKPYTTCTIHNAVVLMKDINNPTLLERYIQESLYTSQASKDGGYSFTATSKGAFLPYIAVNEGTAIRQIQPEGELASGLDVTVIMKVFKGKPNNGVSLEGVIVNEPIRYYNAQVGTGVEELLGIPFVADPSVPLNPKETEVTASVNVEMGVTAGHQGMPPQPVQPVQNPFSANTTPQPQGMPPQPVQPVQNIPQTQSYEANVVPQATPYPHGGSEDVGGIRTDINLGNRQY